MRKIDAALLYHGTVTQHSTDSATTQPIASLSLPGIMIELRTAVRIGKRAADALLELDQIGSYRGFVGSLHG
jgi:hypothetical protein